MIRASCNDSTPLILNATVHGFAIYLDNFAIGDIAEGSITRRKQFIKAIQSGADVLFSLANVAELTGPQGKSLATIRGFLDEIGSSWFPLELDPLTSVKRESEINSISARQIPASRDFLKAFAADRLSESSDRLVDFSQEFFSLGSLIDWLASHRESMRADAAAMDEVLIQNVNKCRANLDREKEWLDKTLPSERFNPSKPATFAFVNLMRTMIIAAKTNPLKKGDGLDFCHAVMASAFANVATLDKRWKRRVESLPKPNGLAHIYYAQELDQMVRDITVALDPTKKIL